jgi:hypothetical protein
MDYDIVNMHPLPGVIHRGQSYELGHFMSKQLRLRDLRDYGLATYAESKPLNQDEDNVASQYKDYDGWTVHRKRAWTTLLAGGHYDYIDFSIIPYLETGTPESQQYLRTWFRYLSAFIHSVDLARARPLPGIVTALPEHTLDVSFGVAGEDVIIYLADARELREAAFVPESAPRGPGEPIRGSVTVALPEGRYQAAMFDPKTGQYSPALEIAGGPAATVMLPEFRHDIVLRLQRVG